MTQLEQFDERNMDALIDRLLPLWNVQGQSNSFNRLFVEMIIRTNMHKNKMQFQITENDELCAIAFAAKKNDESLINSWYKDVESQLTESEKISMRLGLKYHLQMEEKTFAYMENGDVKLCLFTSIKKGKGKKIFELASSFFKEQDFKNIYLWTDSDCNVEWYFQNNFNLVLEEEYKPFSDVDKKYITYVFKKTL